MAIRITCPGCKTTLTFDDDKARPSRPLRPLREGGAKIPAASGAKREKEMAVQNGQSVKAKPKSAPVVPPEWDGDDEPKKRKKKKEQQSGPGLMLGLVASGILLFMVALGGGVWWVVKNRKEGPPLAPEGPELVAKAPEEKAPEISATRRIIPARDDGAPDNAKKGGKGIANSIRGAAYRSERQNELKQIALSYVQYSDEYKGRQS